MLDITWGYFLGRVCYFEELASAWKLVPTDTPLQRIALDATDALSEAPSRLQSLNMVALPINQTQHEVCSFLAQTFGDKLIVLALARGKGLILLRQQSEKIDYWHRIGICLWSVTETDDEFLLGNGDDRWWELEGLFG